MIESFRNRRSAALFRGLVPKGFPAGPANAARLKLRYLDAAAGLEDLRQPPGNRLEALTGVRRGQHSIRFNDQWRLCFIWRDARSVTAETALLLGRRFGTTAELWMNLRTAHELETARRRIPAMA